MRTAALSIWDSANLLDPFSPAVAAFGVRVVLWRSAKTETVLFLLDPGADGRALVAFAHGPRAAEAERLWLAFVARSAVPRHPREAAEAFVRWHSGLVKPAVSQ